MIVHAIKFAMPLAAAAMLAGCDAQKPAPPDFGAALQEHLAAIQARDLDAFAATLTADETLYTVFPNGGALTTRQAAVDLHRDWFADPNWVWEGETVHKIVGADMALALIKYDYRDTPEGAPRSAWLSLLFRLEDGEWRLVHDQNTRIDAPAE
ncbi:MAG: nuclear transport factor 2 family protein [Amphiplicatus sp.]